MKYLYHGFVLRQITASLLPQAEVIHEPGDLAPATQSPATKNPAQAALLMPLPEQRPGRSRTKGHAMPPGSGPAGETCGSCGSLRTAGASRKFHKCGLTQSRWTHGAASDVRLRDPACGKWSRNFERKI